MADSLTSEHASSNNTDVDQAWAEDIGNPINWPEKKKWRIMCTVDLQIISLTLGSSIIAPSVRELAHDLHQSVQVSLLCLSLYVLGWAIGPFVGAPLSEIYGRRIVYQVSILGCAGFAAGSAFPNRMSTLLACRFLSSLLGSPALSVFVGTIVDMWKQEHHGPPISLGMLFIFMAPTLGPIFGGVIAQYAGWRWALRTHFILTLVTAVLSIFLPETHHRTILRSRAKAARASQNSSTAEKGVAQVEQTDTDVGLRSLSWKTTFWLPVRLLAEPIVFLVSVYVGVIYSILYLYFAAFPIIFQGRYHMSQGKAGAMFFGVCLGVLTTGVTAKHMNGLYLRLQNERGGGRTSGFPEGKLPYAMVASVIAPISIFWLGWSGFEHIHWIVPVLSGIPFAWSMVTLFTTMLSYVTESFPAVTAPAMAAGGVVRYLLAAAFPLIVPKLYTNLEPEWAQTMLGFIAIAFIPVPFAFWRWGKKLRERSQYSPAFVREGL